MRPLTASRTLTVIIIKFHEFFKFPLNSRKLADSFRLTIRLTITDAIIGKIIKLLLNICQPIYGCKKESDLKMAIYTKNLLKMAMYTKKVFLNYLNPFYIYTLTAFTSKKRF